jgi:hypothetical protein
MEGSLVARGIYERLVLGIRDGMVENLKILHPHQSSLASTRAVMESSPFDENKTIGVRLRKTKQAGKENRHSQETGQTVRNGCTHHRPLRHA